MLKLTERLYNFGKLCLHIRGRVIRVESFFSSLEFSFKIVVKEFNAQEISKLGVRKKNTRSFTRPNRDYLFFHLEKALKK